jgi:hypothetical protein
MVCHPYGCSRCGRRTKTVQPFREEYLCSFCMKKAKDEISENKNFPTLITKTCKECGSEFKTTKQIRVFCSEDCKMVNYAKKTKAYYEKKAKK